LLQRKQYPLVARHTQLLPSALHCNSQSPPWQGGLFPHPIPLHWLPQPPEAAKAGGEMVVRMGVAQTTAAPAPSLFRAVRREMAPPACPLGSVSMMTPPLEMDGSTLRATPDRFKRCSA